MTGVQTCALPISVYFTGNEHRISLSGEAYFEVVRDKAYPFYVEARGYRTAAGPVPPPGARLRFLTRRIPGSARKQTDLMKSLKKPAIRKANINR